MRRTNGNILLALAGLLSIGIASIFVFGLAGSGPRLAREAASEQALNTAREALLAYAAGRAIDPVVGPGYLPCPDLDGDGWAESTCGSLDGRTGQAQRLGRLPWKTLGLPELRDGHDELLWYAVSTKYKGLLNCAASVACVDMNPDAALGTLTVRDSHGAVLHDGRIDDPRRAEISGAVAVVIAPGPPLVRHAGSALPRSQSRATPAERADATNYLDVASGAAFGDEDNAAFVDRTDVRSANGDGFIAGPVRAATGDLGVNDRLAVVTYGEVMSRARKRVAQEVLRCVREFAAANGGRPPAPAPACRSSSGNDAWREAAGARFGRVADGTLSACGLATNEAPNWWLAWRRHVFYALDVQPVDETGRTVGPRRAYAVIVAGAARPGTSHAAGTEADLGQWLDAPHRELERRDPDPAPGCVRGEPRAPCPPGECDRVVLAPPAANRADIVVAAP
ncbi:hypothetical protein BWI17_08520 [Betaproteobacteria bacterium GR16-43]|nr:hypothetical protein BWI17_08520 [Betaproteobacteria bacterium GR16-43]